MDFAKNLLSFATVAFEEITSFGGQLSKKHITFDKANGQAMSPKYIEDKIDPYLVMLINF